ncbi:MAG: RNA 2',3'-cyclic phosphodiesterase [Phycisphaerae bacterium]
MAVRTFLAIDLDGAILDRLEAAQKSLDDGASKVNWVARPNVHLTLNFLGDVPDEILSDVCAIAAGAAAKVEPFEIEVAGVVAMPPRGPLRMFWAGVNDPTGRLAALQDGLAVSLTGLRLRQEERAFKPHITLARVKFARNPAQLRQSAAALAAQEFGIQHVEEVVAYASRLTSDGPIYTPIARAKLGK